MTSRVLAGPFLTRAEAAERAGLPAGDLPYRPDLIRIGGRQLPEAYCSFQIGPSGIRSNIGTIVLSMRGSYDDLTIANWLAAPNPALRGEAPLLNLLRTGVTGDALAALHDHPPAAAETSEEIVPATQIAAVRTRAATQRHKRRARRPVTRPAPSR